MLITRLTPYKVNCTSVPFRDDESHVPDYPITPAFPQPVTYTTTKKWRPSSYGKTRKRLAHKGELRQTGSGKFPKLVTFTSESKKVSRSRHCTVRVREGDKVNTCDVSQFDSKDECACVIGGLKKKCQVLPPKKFNIMHTKITTKF